MTTLTRPTGVSSSSDSGMGGSGMGGSSTATSAGGAGATDAANADPIGFASLNRGTRGGRDGQTVTATSYDELKSYAESSDPYVILVDGTISNGENGGVISIKSNKTLIGIGSTAFLHGIGIEIKNNSNIILRNLRVSMTGVTTRTETPGVYTASDDEGLPKILVNDGDAISI